MKQLFENRFSFVKLADELLTSEQLEIKRQYEKTYNGIDGIICKPCEAEKAKVSKFQAKINKLREVRADDERAGNGSNGGRVDSSDIQDILPNRPEIVD